MPDIGAGAFSLQYTEEGVYLVVSNRGMPDMETCIVEALQRKGIANYSKDKLISAFRSGEDRIFVCNPVAETTVDEDIRIEVGNDGMLGFIALLPSDPDGKLLSLQDALGKLSADGKITHGINEQAVEQLLERKQYFTKAIIATGRQAMDGEDGKLIFRFSKEHDLKPLMLEDGKVDFYTLDLFSPAEKGQLLVERVPPTLGTDGVDVSGRELKARPGKDVLMPPCTNAEVNEDNTQMRATIDGKVDWIDNRKVVVSNEFVVHQDVDMSTGNITFGGSIVVKGNVRSGMKVKAAGNIEIAGIVEESAEVQAGGDITLHMGVQGADKAIISAGGNVAANFIERANVYAKGDIVAASSMHSTLDSRANIVIIKGKGTLFGGTTRADKMIAAQVAGSVSHVTTNIVIGIGPENLRRLQKLREDLEIANVEMEKIVELKSKISQLPGQEEMIERVNASMKSQLENKLKLQNEIKGLEQQILDTQDGKIHVTGKVYPGVRVVIGEATLVIDEETKYSTFKKRNEDIEMTLCEYTAT